jgi:Mg2+ and Co2+ transporter CorA
MSQYGNYTNDLNNPTKMKKTLTIITTLLLLPFVLAGFLFAIPAYAFKEGYTIFTNMIKSGRI